MKLFAKSRTISLIIGLVLVALILPGVVSAASTSSPNAQLVSTTIPSSMIAGQSYPVSVTLKNTGTMTWNEASMIRLGGVGDGAGDAYKFGPARIRIPAGTSVLPGAHYTFSFTMTAPATAGSYAPKYRMVWEGHQWFGARAAKTIKVVNQGSAVPTAQFIASTTSGQAPLGVQFTDKSVSAGTTSYAWDINNDGKTDYTTKNPLHTYTAAGTYTIKLTVTSAAGSDSEIKTSYIKVSTSVVKPTVTPTVSGSVPPKAQFTSNVTTGKTEMVAVQFMDQSTGTAPMTYHWDFSDGEGKLPENTQKNPVWRFWQDAGTIYTVTLTVTNAYGSDTIVKQNYITLGTTSSAVPVAAFTSNVQGGNAPLTVQFADQSAGAPLSYAWDFKNDKTIDSTQKSPSFTYTTAGTYTVNLTVTNANGKDSEIKTGYIRVTAAGTTPLPTPTPTPTAAPAKLPAAQFTANTTLGKYPLAVQFTDQSVSAGTSTYAWDVNNDGKTDYTTKNPVHTYPALGTYTVKLTVTNASGSDSEIKTGYITTTSSPVVGSGVYGYASNPTGNPIGGGAGYTRIITGTEASVKYVVSTKAELLTALKSAKAGETVFVRGTAVIDMTGTPSTTIPAGVTLASDRGLTGSAGGLLKRTKNLNGGWEEPMLIVGGDNVRVTGLRLEGEMYPQDYGNDDVYAGSINERFYLVGIYAENRKGFEVDNCELYGWAWSTISLRQNGVAPIPFIHHNYIHHNQARGEGYGVNLYGGNALIEANIFDYNRHDVTGAGMAGEQYEVRYNHVIGHGTAIGASHFDVHQDEETGTGAAGAKYLIHHNTVDTGTVATVHIRARPTTGVYVDHNIINARDIENGVPGGLPIYQTNSNQNMFVTNNYWMGTLYTTDKGIVWYQ